MTSPDSSDCLSVRDSYLAMYYFITAYWERGGKVDGSVTLLTHALGPVADPQNRDGLQTADPAFWSDWLDAVGAARERGLPREL